MFQFYQMLEKIRNQMNLSDNYLFLFNSLEYTFNSNNSCERSQNTFSRERLVIYVVLQLQKHIFDQSSSFCWCISVMNNYTHTWRLLGRYWVLSRRLNIVCARLEMWCTCSFAVRLELFSIRKGVYDPFLKLIGNRICSTEFGRILSFDWSASHLNLSSNELGDIVQTFEI